MIKKPNTSPVYISKQCHQYMREAALRLKIKMGLK
jgi:hypothetical protein